MSQLFQSITVQGLYDDATGLPIIVATGTPTPASALLIAGSDGTNLQALSVDTTGKLNVNASISLSNVDIEASGVPLTATFFGSPAVAALNTYVVNPITVSGPVSVTGTVAVTQSTSPWVVSGTVTANAGTGTFTVAGSLTNNNAAPAANNIGALTALANAANPTWTEGDQVLASVDLSGHQRTVDAATSATGAAPSAKAIQVAGSDGTNLQAIRVSTNRTTVMIPADEALASSVSYFSADMGDAQVSIANPAVKPLISVRTNSATVLFILRGLNLLGGGQLVRYQLIKNPTTLTGSTFATSRGNMQIDTAATAFAGGTVVDSGYFGSAHFIKSIMQAAASGTPGDTFTLAASSIAGTVKVSGSIQWSETAAAL